MSSPTSVNEEWLAELEADFNFGHHLDLNLYAESLTYLSAIMGFGYQDSLEAVVVTNAVQDPQAAVFFLLNDLDAKVIQRQDARLQRQRYLLTTEEADAVIAEIERKRQMLRSAREKQLNDMKNLDEILTQNKQQLYEEFLRGLLGSLGLNRDVEKIIAGVDAYRMSYSISKAEHQKALQHLGYNLEQFEQTLKEIPNSTANRKTDCKVCHEARSECVSLDCMHLCYCESCAHRVNAQISSRLQAAPHCPVCKARVTEARRIYV